MPDKPDDTESLLRQAEDALHSISLRLLGVSNRLSEPFSDAPGLSPWSMTIGPQARRAHDLATAIRKHLGIRHHMPSRALGTPPLTASDALRPAVEALYMAGIKTGKQYDQLASEIIAGIYEHPSPPAPPASE